MVIYVISNQVKISDRVGPSKVDRSSDAGRDRDKASDGGHSSKTTGPGRRWSGGG